MTERFDAIVVLGGGVRAGGLLPPWSEARFELAMERDEAFGRPGSSRGTSAYPQIRFVSLVEDGTHVLFGSRMADYATSEIALAKTVIPSLDKGMLCLADRGFFGFEIWQQAAATGADLLWRLRKNILLSCEQRLPDGSYLSRISPSQKKQRRRRNGIVVRVIEYRLDGVEGAEPLYPAGLACPFASLPPVAAFLDRTDVMATPKGPNCEKFDRDPLDGSLSLPLRATDMVGFFYVRKLIHSNQESSAEILRSGKLTSSSRGMEKAIRPSRCSMTTSGRTTSCGSSAIRERTPNSHSGSLLDESVPGSVIRPRASKTRHVYCSQVNISYRRRANVSTSMPN
ncbi:MAG: transposase [Bryobacteraceae bacterium]|nr:transposase [Bryobacteraceae bacterium]